jgi:hypothetical protein
VRVLASVVLRGFRDRHPRFASVGGVHPGVVRPVGGKVAGWMGWGVCDPSTGLVVSLLARARGNRSAGAGSVPPQATISTQVRGSSPLFEGRSCARADHRVLHRPVDRAPDVVLTRLGRGSCWQGGDEDARRRDPFGWSPCSGAARGRLALFRCQIPRALPRRRRPRGDRVLGCLEVGGGAGCADWTNSDPPTPHIGQAEESGALATGTGDPPAGPRVRGSIRRRPIAHGVPHPSHARVERG